MKPFPGEIPAARLLDEVQARGAPSLDPGRLLGGSWRKTLRGLSDEELLGADSLADRESFLSAEKLSSERIGVAVPSRLRP